MPLELDPEDSEAYTYRGISYQLLGKDDLAMADLSKALELDPEDSLAYTYRGISYQEQGDDEKALADFDAALKLDPEDPLTYSARGESLFYLGLDTEAVQDLTRAIELAGTTSCWRRRILLPGRVVFLQRGRSKAVEISAQPRTVQTILCMRSGGRPHELGEMDLAQADFEQAVELARTKRSSSRSVTRRWRQAAVHPRRGLSSQAARVAIPEVRAPVAQAATASDSSVSGGDSGRIRGRDEAD
jgi:tetratricopeptide (TPR) repeat protein